MNNNKKLLETKIKSIENYNNQLRELREAQKIVEKIMKDIYKEILADFIPFSKGDVVLFNKHNTIFFFEEIECDTFDLSNIIGYSNGNDQRFEIRAKINGRMNSGNSRNEFKFSHTYDFNNPGQYTLLKAANEENESNA